MSDACLFLLYQMILEILLNIYYTPLYIHVLFLHKHCDRSNTKCIQYLLMLKLQNYNRGEKLCIMKIQEELLGSF